MSVAEARPASVHEQRSLRVQLIATFVGLPVNFATWVWLGRLLDLEVIFTARAAWVTGTLIALVIIFAPLALGGPWPARWRAFVRRWFVMAEIIWWWIVIPVVAALIQYWRGREPQALALFGVAGALQFYNVCCYMAYGGIVEGFSIVATDSILAPILYWGMNAIWGLAGGLAGALAFVLLFRFHVRDPGAARELPACSLDP